MAKTQKFDLDTDTTLGGSNASDYIAPSQKAIKTYVDNHSGSGGTATDVQINGTSITSNDVANIVTNSAYNASSNKIATMSDLPTIPTVNNATLTIQKNGSAVKTFTANASADVTCNITVPTKTSDITNDSGYITGISSSDVTTALGYTPYNSTNPNGYTSNVGTVTSVNNTQPDANGNVTISASVDIDNSTITENSSNQIQTVAVKDNRSGNAIKTWTGTRAQYNAITTKDANTLYNITDDSDITYSMLELLYPVGSIYIGTMATCPLATLGIGTWTLKTSRFLVDKQEPTAENNYTWYNLYSDGWCEQGSNYYLPSGASEFNPFVSLIKNYTDTNYCVVTTSCSGIAYTSSTSNAQKNSVMLWTGMINRKSSTGFYLNRLNEADGNNVSWYACGYTLTVSQLNQWERVS